MEEKKIILALFFCSLCGLLLIFFFQADKTYSEKNLEELLQNCDGKVKVSGEILDSSVSKNGNYVLKLAPKVSVVSGKAISGDRITVQGRASFYGGSCWVFAERAE